MPPTFRYFANHRATPSIAQINFSILSALFALTESYRQVNCKVIKIEYGNEFNNDRMVDGHN